MKTENEMEKAVKILKEGGIVIFPTDTAYAIGCRIDRTETIERLFSLRKRPLNQAVPVLVESIKMAQKFLEPIPQDVHELTKKFWPGQLTIVLPAKKKKVPELVMGGGLTLGVRMPDHKDLLEGIRAIGVPILGPSANFSGAKTPFKYDDLDKRLIDLVDFVVKKDPFGYKVSTVIDCTKKPWRILREGAVKISNSGEITLFIDTSSNEKVIVALQINNERYEEERDGNRKGQITLPLIENILKKHKIKLQDLSSIEVKIGPGSFTGLRVGISIANALGFALGVGINKKDIGKLVVPNYK